MGWETEMSLTTVATPSIGTPTRERFGTFFGVFLPTILTILGVILYLRMGYFLSSIGLMPTLLIITLATVVSLITALSISATATNMKIGDGGVYYILSRTFGVEIGSAIGIPLYLAQGIGIAFYISGFSESLNMTLPFIPIKLISVTILCILMSITLISTKVALKTQFIILIMVLASLVSFFLGLKTPTESVPILSQPPPFWSLFALFFPAVTGIEAGLSMGGQLKNSRKSLPFGTLAAVLTGYVLYIGITGLLYVFAPSDKLASPMIMQELSLIKELVLIGIWGATLSGALSALIGAPLTLQTLAEDTILPEFLKKKRVAIITTAAIALVTIFCGNIDQIAPVLSMFFLISYGMLNFVAAVEGIMSNPSWRPTFRTPWLISLFGAFLCFTFMLLINVGVTIGVLFGLVLLYFLIKKREVSANWEDVRHGLLLYFSRFFVYRLANMKASAKSWRPNLLVFIGDPFLRGHLVKFTAALTHKKGFLSMATITQDDLTKGEKDLHYRSEMNRFFEQSQIPALFELKYSENIMEGMTTLINHYGIGPLTPNTIVLGATQKKEKFELFSEVIRTSHFSNRNVVIIRESIRGELLRKKRHKQISVWWGGKNSHNSDFMLVLAYMLQTSQEWQGSTLTLNTVVRSHDEVQEMEAKLCELTEKGRLSITPNVVIAKEDEDLFSGPILRASENNDLVFFGLRPPTPDESVTSYASYYENLLKKTEGFPPLAFVLAGENLPFHQILD